MWKKGIRIVRRFFLRTHTTENQADLPEIDFCRASLKMVTDWAHLLTSGMSARLMNFVTRSG
jgi:hypothetical protein